MQPPTEPTRADARKTPRGDNGELYRRHHRDLHRAVAHAVNAPRELIEDACQNAWAIMLRAQPDPASIFGWLYVVANREAFRLCERDRRDIPLETILPSGSWDAAIADAFSIDDILEAHEALEILASLPDRQRADLALLVAGFNDNEIAELTGGRTYTNGEVGLDGSREGRPSLVAQRRVFEHVLGTPGIDERVLSVHSRGAEAETVAALHEAGVTAVLHWVLRCPQARRARWRQGCTSPSTRRCCVARRGRGWFSASRETEC
jgi:DNA-directed RNA polymerase specialized sigma24 family protein